MKAAILTAAALLALGGPAQAFTATSTYTTYETTCTTRPARDAGFISAAGQTVRITSPERRICTERATGQIRSTVTY